MQGEKIIMVPIAEIIAFLDFFEIVFNSSSLRWWWVVWSWWWCELCSCSSSWWWWCSGRMKFFIIKNIPSQIKTAGARKFSSDWNVFINLYPMIPIMMPIIIVLKVCISPISMVIHAVSFADQFSDLLASASGSQWCGISALDILNSELPMIIWNIKKWF